jgi:hypothetical protein
VGTIEVADLAVEVEDLVREEEEEVSVRIMHQQQVVTKNLLTSRCLVANERFKTVRLLHTVDDD